MGARYSTIGLAQTYAANGFAAYVSHRERPERGPEGAAWEQSLPSACSGLHSPLGLHESS